MKIDLKDLTDDELWEKYIESRRLRGSVWLRSEFTVEEKEFILEFKKEINRRGLIKDFVYIKNPFFKTPKNTSEASQNTPLHPSSE